MKRILYSSLLFVSAVAALTLNSCKKEEPDTETQSAIDNSVCEGEFTGRMGIINSIAIKEQGVRSMRTPGQPMVSFVAVDTLDGFPITMYIDYGTGTVDPIDGKTRKGMVTAKFSDSWDSLGTTITVKLINYYVKTATGANFVQYACDSIMIGHPSATTFTNNIIGGKCVAASWNLEWAANRTLTQTAGMGDTVLTNDVFQFTGNAVGKTREGKNYTVNVTSPVTKAMSCTWIQSGRIDLTPEGKATRTVDYGSGICDDQATLTINGNTFAFTMN
jgi:hypothetical protein